MYNISVKQTSTWTGTINQLSNFVIIYSSPNNLEPLKAGMSLQEKDITGTGDP